MINREYKIAINTYPFFDSRIYIQNPAEEMEMDGQAGNKKGAIIYIHIPFCDSICDFCIYNRTITKSDLMEEYTRWLIEEMKLYAETEYIQKIFISAVYFGGGTPSALSDEQLVRIIDACKSSFNINQHTEFTIEANPISADREKMHCLKNHGINRISAGIQTFNSQHRTNLGLKSSRHEVFGWLEQAAMSGFHTLAIDLMFGLPDQTSKEWIEDLEHAALFPVQHISIYELYPFPNTKLGKRISDGVFKEPSNEERYSMFLMAQEFLMKNHYRRQIVPEFHLDKHSSMYWDHAFDAYTDTIALGVSSYGFINGRSYQNAAVIKNYINIIKQHKLPVERISSKSSKYVMAERDMVFSLRKGCVNKDEFIKRNFPEAIDVFLPALQHHIRDGLLFEDAYGYNLTAKGRYKQEDVAVSFMNTVFKERSKAYEKIVLSTQQLYHG